ncbi:MAG TPA: protein-glutamate O-methyltransferase CheR [Actinomycetota bacterium]|nr:protein-glutamate O-methyltransferase CheR [Actinomycetota bacterium]
MKLVTSEFEYIRELVFRRTSIVLEPGKEYLAETRLDPIRRSLGMGSLSELIVALRADPLSPLHDEVAEAMTTNETSFFRDGHPWDGLRTDVLPDLIERNKNTRTLRIWSAGCSTGQEPFSIAMVLREYFPALVNTWLVQILATDVSATVLDQARHGRYGQLEVNRGLPVRLLVKYFRQDGIHWYVDDSIRSMVTFERRNLFAPAWVPPPMDIVFLRNVTIYFSESGKRETIRRAAAAMRPSGWLLLGAAETALHLDESLRREPVGKTVWYRREGG